MGFVELDWTDERIDDVVFVNGDCLVVGEFVLDLLEFFDVFLGGFYGKVLLDVSD